MFKSQENWELGDVATASVHSEKTRMKKLMKMIIIIIITEKPFTSKCKKEM